MESDRVMRSMPSKVSSPDIAGADSAPDPRCGAGELQPWGLPLEPAT